MLCFCILPLQWQNSNMKKDSGTYPGIVIKQRIILRRWHYREGVRKFRLNGPPPLLCISFARMDSLVLTMPNLDRFDILMVGLSFWHFSS
ncbi:unnamed protein product [Prunus armeniaca]